MNRCKLVSSIELHPELNICGHDKMLEQLHHWVVATIFIINLWQLPARQFNCCQESLWNEMPWQLLWNVSFLARGFFILSFLPGTFLIVYQGIFHSFPGTFFIVYQGIFHYLPGLYFISLLPRDIFHKCLVILPIFRKIVWPWEFISKKGNHGPFFQNSKYRKIISIAFFVHEKNAKYLTKWN